METDVTAHLTAGAVVVYALEWLKRSNFPLLRMDTKNANRVASALAALAAATGIVWTYDQATTEIVIRFTVTGVLTGLWEFAKQFMAQQLIYDAAVNRPRSGGDSAIRQQRTASEPAQGA